MADLVLLKAEILNAKGDTPLAVIELDKIRSRAGIVDYSGEVNVVDVDAAILKERARELGFEGKRWFDLIRFDKVSEFVDNMKGVDSHFFLWPISAN